MKLFRAESVCLRLHCNLIKSVLDKQVLGNHRSKEELHVISPQKRTQFGLLQVTLFMSAGGLQLFNIPVD